MNAPHELVSHHSVMHKLKKNANASASCPEENAGVKSRVDDSIVLMLPKY